MCQSKFKRFLYIAETVLWDVHHCEYTCLFCIPNCIVSSSKVRVVTFRIYNSTDSTTSTHIENACPMVFMTREVTPRIALLTRLLWLIAFKVRANRGKLPEHLELFRVHSKERATSVQELKSINYTGAKTLNTSCSHRTEHTALTYGKLHCAPDNSDWSKNELCWFHSSE